MTEAIALAKSISELGVLIIIAAAAIYIAYQNWKIKQDKDIKDSNNFNNLIQDIQNQNNELIEKLISANQKSNITPQQYNTNSKIGNEINLALESMRYKTNASRASLIQFHNGGHNLANQSFLKMDMTNEKLKLNVASISREFRDQYRDFFSYLCTDLSDNGICNIENIDTLKDKDTSMYNFFIHKGVLGVHAISINDSQGYMIGFLMLNFTSEDSQDLEQINKCLNDKKIKIETLLALN